MVKIKTYIPKSRERIRTTYNKRKHIEPVSGQVLPKLNDLSLGGSRDFDVAICQIDIVNSTNIADQLKDHRRWFTLLNIVLSELSYTLRDHTGVLDKYTGDGLMAIFGADQPGEKAVVNAVEYCLTAFSILKDVINPFLATKSLPYIGLKAGIDYGSVLIGRLGLKGTNDLIIVGKEANMAAKLEDIASSREIMIGDDVYKRLPQKEKKWCKVIQSADWEYQYKFYKYTGRWKYE